MNNDPDRCTPAGGELRQWLSAAQRRRLMEPTAVLPASPQAGGEPAMAGSKRRLHARLGLLAAPLCLIAMSAYASGSTLWNGTMARIGQQNSNFSVSFDAAPSTVTGMSYVGLAQHNAHDVKELAAALRFNTLGQIDVLNGASYSADTPLTYSANITYHVRMSVNVPAHIYSVYVTPPGQSEVALAVNAAFAPQQGSVPALAFADKVTAGGNAGITNFAVTPTCPYAAHGVDDGCTGSLTSGFSNPTLLAKYGSKRPPWNVAGVDYLVGAPTTGTFKDWQSLSVPGLDIGGGYIRCDGPAAAKPTSATVELDQVDFTTHGGTYIYIPSGGCHGIKITRSKFGNAGNQQPCTYMSYYAIQSQNAGAAVVLMHNTFNMSGCLIGQASVVNSAGPTTLMYNYFGHMQAQLLQAAPGPYPVDYRFNYIEDCCYQHGAHMNFQEFGEAVGTSSDMIAFNTSYEYQNLPAGGEEFQFYGNAGGVQAAARLMNNTIIALDTGSCQSKQTGCLVSYAIHGNGEYNPTTSLSAPAMNMNNYFDRSGMYGAYYPQSLAGWTSQGNYDLTTGAEITP